jgi:hypothetical protein
MQRMTGWAACLALAILTMGSRAEACQGQSVLFEDTFEALDPAWGAADDFHKSDNSNLVLTPDTNKYSSHQNQSTTFTDADICVKFETAKTDDIPSTSGGLVFWAYDYTNYYTLDVAANGYVRVSRWLKDRWLTPVAWIQSPAIKQGLGQWNDLRLTLKGKDAVLYINGQEIVKFKGQPPQGGTLIGIQGNSPANGRAEFHFADLKITD